MHKYAEFLDPKMRSPFSLFICDLDRYKKINDNYGHKAGDAILQNVAGILAQHCRDNDSVYRWGGDEFVMVMPGTDLEECKKIADEIRTDVKDSSVTVSVLPIKVTMSIGCCLYDRSKTIEENINVADDKLFTAKDSGRNKVFG